MISRTFIGFFIEGFIIIITYYAYKSYFLFGFNVVLAALFLLSAFTLKSMIFKSWREMKENLKEVLFELSIDLEDLNQEIETWKNNIQE